MIEGGSPIEVARVKIPEITVDVVSSVSYWYSTHTHAYAHAHAHAHAHTHTHTHTLHTCTESIIYNANQPNVIVHAERWHKLPLGKTNMS